MINAVTFVIEKLSALNINVRSSYDTAVPKYPLITVMQMDNYEIAKYTTIDTKENVSAIPIQLDVYARNMTIDGEITSASDAAEHYRILADEIMQEQCGMRRTGAPPIIPHTTDSSVMRAISRYDSMYDLEHEIFHKK